MDKGQRQSDDAESRYQEQYLDNRFDSANPAQILPLLSDKGDRKLLKKWIANQEDCVLVDETSPKEAEFDLCLFDGQSLIDHEKELLSRKQDEAPVHLPYLLLLSESDWSIVSENRGKLADNVIDATVDEIVSLPLKKVELNWRVEGLLRLRSQSLGMREKEAKLQEFKEAADSAGHAIYITDTDGTITYVNSAFERITGYRAAEAVGSNPRIMKSGEMSSSYYEQMWETLTSGDVWEEEVINQRKNGEIYYAKQTIAPIIGPNGSIKSYVAIQMDITERKRREESLREYRQAVESSKDLLTALDEEFNYLFANEMYREYHGVGPVDITEYTVPQVIGEDAFETAKPKIEKALNGQELQYERTRTHPEKGKRTFDVSYFPLKDLEGEIRGVGASMRDITRQKRLQNSLKESKEQYESLFNSIRDAILVANTDQEIINCNSKFVDLFGYELEEIEGKQTKYMCASDEEFQKMVEATEGHVGDPQFTHEVEYEKKSGQTFPGETNIFYLRNAENEIEGFIGVVRDVSERQNRLQQLQRVDRVLQHNFHNDINVIQGFAEQIEAEAASPVNEFAQKVIEAGEGLLRTVENEREITKFLSAPPNPESLNLRRVCDVVTERVSHSHPQAAILTECSEAPIIEATPAIELAIEELLVNAITHSPETEPQVVLASDSLNGTVAIRVQDTNPRIPEMDQKVTIGEEEASSLYHGSGMGLWLVSLITNHTGGTLKFETNEPNGNIVSIILPMN